MKVSRCAGCGALLEENDTRLHQEFHRWLETLFYELNLERRIAPPPRFDAMGYHTTLLTAKDTGLQRL